MKKIITHIYSVLPLLVIIGLVIIFLTYTYKTSNNQAQKLSLQESQLRKEVKILTNRRESILQEISKIANNEAFIELSKKKKELNLQEKEINSKLNLIEIDRNKYILTLKLKQSHFTLNLSKHIKDSVNAVEFNVAVDKDLYEDLDIGDDLFKSFREGSFWTEGSIGSWSITVTDKKVVKRE